MSVEQVPEPDGTVTAIEISGPTRGGLIKDCYVNGMNILDITGPGEVDITGTVARRSPNPIRNKGAQVRVRDSHFSAS